MNIHAKKPLTSPQLLVCSGFHEEGCARWERRAHFLNIAKRRPRNVLMTLCLSFLGLSYTLPQTWWLKIAALNSITVLEARSPKPRCLRATLPLKTPGEDPPSFSSACRLPTPLDSSPRHSSLHLCLSASLCVSYKDTVLEPRTTSSSQAP